MSIYFSLLISILGLIMFFAAKANQDVKEIGRLSFFAGLLVFLFEVVTKVIHF